MIDHGIGTSAARLPAASLMIAPMSKAERLHRWADALELQTRLAGLEEAAASRASGPLAVAFEDWAFRAEGLHGAGVEQALEFFDLSASEMRRILSPAAGSQPLAASVAARRVRTLAEEAETEARSDVRIAGAREVTGRPARRAAARSLAAMVGRRKNGAAAAAPPGREVKRRAADAGASARRRASG